MKFVNEEYKIINMPNILSDDSIESYLFDIARYCVSDDKIEKVSNLSHIKYDGEEKWILKHLIVTFEVPQKVYNNILNLKYVVSCENSSDIIPYNIIKNIMSLNISLDENSGFLRKNKYIVSGTLKAFNDIYSYALNSKNPLFSVDGICKLCAFIALEYPDYISNPPLDISIKGIHVVHSSKIDTFQIKERFLHKWMTVKLTMSSYDISYLCMHLPNNAVISFAKNYDENNGLNFIIPSNFMKIDKNLLKSYDGSMDVFYDSFYDCKLHKPVEKWVKMCNKYDKLYNYYIDEIGYPYDVIRSKMPNSIATSIIITMNLNSWDEFFIEFVNKRKHETISPIAKSIFDHCNYYKEICVNVNIK